MNVDKLEQLMREATPGPVVASLQDTDEETWALHGNDPSYEATLAQFWSGEHNNEANAKLHEVLHNSCAALIERIRAGDKLAEKYAEAITDISDWAAYAADFFQEKHDLPGCLDGHRKALAEYDALKGEKPT